MIRFNSVYIIYDTKLFKNAASFVIASFWLLFTASAFAQVVGSDPAFPSVESGITIFFDASLGDKGLNNFAGDVYIHTGIITDKSDPDNPVDPVNNPGDWKYIKTAYGQNTASTKMTRISANLYSINIPDIRTYYGVAVGDSVLQIAMVFRSGDSKKLARAEDGSDIFIDLYGKGTYVKFNNPTQKSTFLELNSTLNIQVIGAALGSEIQSVKLFEGESELATTNADTLNYILTANNSGRKKLTAVSKSVDGKTDSASIFYLVPNAINDAPRPAGFTQGITYYNSDPTKVTLSLLAPYKELVYVIGEFNDWELFPEYQMNRDIVAADEVYWWVDITGLEPGEKYAFQYLIDNTIKIADPYAEEVLHPDDTYIPASTYPNLKLYPYGETTEYVSIIETDKEEFNWTDNDWTPPAKENLVIYELLVRDFSATHSFKAVIDSLDYLQRLGINAIELMPVNEFEGNNSWGYNPSFYFATDRYYGPAGDLKRLINEAHNRGIAVILDAVYNHSFGQSPMVRLFNEGNYGKPTAQNIWFNTEARHPFNVGYDFDHSSRFTQQFIDSVNRYWVREFHVDGFRYDLSKGFTQKFTSDVGAWNQYDQSRVDLLNRMKAKIHEFDPDTYLILEHLGNNDEETVLANSGFMLWGIMHEQYKDAAMGFDGNLSRISYKERGWANPHLVGYMESHDEERIMYEIEKFGNSFNGYNTKKLSTSLNRIKQANAFLLLIPGPKMFWQFGEYGYDISINQNGRTGEKPILWNYLNNADRYRLYQTTSELAKLKTQHPAFATTDFEIDIFGKQKKFLLKSATDVQVLGNFDVVNADVWPYGHNSGSGKWWYEFFSGDSLFINESFTSPINMKPGEFRIYSTTPLGTPPPGILNENEAQISLSTSTITFTEIKADANTPPFQKNLKVTNSGSAALTITDITNFSSEYSISPKSATIAAGSSLDLTISFNPPALGSYTDEFTIKTTSIGETKFSVNGSYSEAFPNKPTLLLPVNNAKNVALGSTFTWQELDDADSYEIEIRNVSIDSIIETESGLTDNRYIAVNLGQNSNYAWRVRAKNEFGNGNWSDAFIFTTVPFVPAKTKLVSPDSSATGISTSPELRWIETENADSYELQISENEDFSLLKQNQLNIEPTFTQVTGLSANSEYFWRVRAKNITGEGTWSNTWVFITSTIGTPELEYPTNKSFNISLSSQIKWKSAESAETYTIQISKQKDFKIRAENEGLTDTLFTPDYLEKNTTYFWRVRANSSSFESAWSEVRTFSTPFDAPEKPTLLMPQHQQEKVGDEVFFSWTPSDLAFSYQIQIAKESNFVANSVDSSEIKTPKLTISKKLERDYTFYWRVRAMNATDSSSWSDTLAFSTLAKAPLATNLISPADSVTEVNTTVSFRWNASLDGNQYQFQLATKPNFEEKLDTLIANDTSIVVSNLEFDKTYYWRVKTYGEGGEGAWSEVQLFKTKSEIPEVPTIIAPQNMDVIDVHANRFVWSNSLRATTYQIQMSVSNDFSKTIVDSINILNEVVENIKLKDGSTYYWRVRAVNRTGASAWTVPQKFYTGIINSLETDAVPQKFKLEQNYPNPFNPTTTIKYALPTSSKVTIAVYNMIGQRVITLVNKRQEAGFHAVEFDASALASGMYMFRITAENYSEIKKLTLIK